MLKLFKILDAPNVAKHKTYEQMEELLRFFPSSFPKQKCFDEYKLVRIESLYSKLNTSEVPVENFLIQNLALKDELAEKKFFNLELFIKSIISVLRGNADVGLFNFWPLFNRREINDVWSTLNSRLNVMDAIYIRWTKR